MSYSGYILFAAEYRKVVERDIPGLSFGEKSKIVGAKWRSLSGEEKEGHHARAREMCANLPDAKKTPYDPVVSEPPEPPEPLPRLRKRLPPRSPTSTPKPKKNSSQGPQGQGVREKDIPLAMSCSEEPFVQVLQECKVKIEPDLVKTESVGDTWEGPSQSVSLTLDVDVDVKPPVQKTEEKEIAQVYFSTEKLNTLSAIHSDTESCHSTNKEEISNPSSNCQPDFQLQSSTPEELPAPYFVATPILMAAIESSYKEKSIHSTNETNQQSTTSNHRGSAGRSTNVMPYVIAPIEPAESGPGMGQCHDQVFEGNLEVGISSSSSGATSPVRDTADSPLNCEQGTEVSSDRVPSSSQGQKWTIDPKKGHKCKTCRRVFSRPDGLTKHKCTHYTCVFCGKVLANQCLLREHTQAHLHKCPVCAETFTQSAYLVKHLKAHLREAAQ